MAMDWVMMRGGQVVSDDRAVVVVIGLEEKWKG